MKEALHVANNKKLFRFEIDLQDGSYATLQYRWLKGNIVLMHTVVPNTYRHKGTGSFLVKKVLEYIRTHHLKMIVYCPFVNLYVQKHPENNDLLAGNN